MKQATLGLNIERLYATVLVTRDELEKLKASISGLSNENVVEIREVLSKINEAHALVEAEYNNFMKLWRAAVVEYNKFMDGSDWNESILPHLKQQFSDKMNSFLDQFLAIVKICKDFFDSYLEDKYLESTTKYRLDKNPYFALREDISEKSEKVRKSFTMPDKAGFNWYSAKISDEYLSVSSSIIMLAKIGNKANNNKLQSFLKGNSVTEVLVFHPRHGMINIMSSGIDNHKAGMVDPETGANFTKFRLKNLDGWQGHYNEYKARMSYSKNRNCKISYMTFRRPLNHFDSLSTSINNAASSSIFSLNTRDSKIMTAYGYDTSTNALNDNKKYRKNRMSTNGFEKGYNKVFPDYLAVFRNFLDESGTRQSGDSYFIVKVKDNEPLKRKTPKNYQVMRVNTEKDNLLTSYTYRPYNTADNAPSPNFTRKLLSSSMYRSNLESPKPGYHNNYESLLTKTFNTPIVGEKEHEDSLIDNNKLLSEHFPISTDFFTKTDSILPFINISENGVVFAANLRGNDTGKQDRILMNIETLKNNNVIYYKKGGFGKTRDEFDLFRNWVLRVAHSQFSQNWDKTYVNSLSHLNVGRTSNERFLYLKHMGYKYITSNGENIYPVVDPISGNITFVERRPIEDIENIVAFKDYWETQLFNDDSISSIFYHELKTTSWIAFAINSGLSRYQNELSAHYTYDEYFDLYDNPNKYNNYFIITGSIDNNNTTIPSEKSGFTHNIVCRDGFNNFTENYLSNYTVSKKRVNVTGVGSVETEIKSDNIDHKYASRSLLNNSALSANDEQFIKEKFYEEVDDKMRDYEKMTIGTLICIPYSPENPKLFGRFAKAGSILSKQEYPDLYRLIGDTYLSHYEEDMPEGSFGLPVLNDRYLEYVNNPEEIGKVYEDSIPDLGYTFNYMEDSANTTEDQREGFLSENGETLTSIKLASGRSGGVDRKKIKVNYNSTANVTSGTDFKLDYYIKVK